MANPFLFQLVDSNASGIQREKAAFGSIDQNNMAPDLITFTNFNRKQPSQSKVQLIDVVHDFQWTQTPQSGRHEVPFVRMSEYRVEFNSLVQNLKYQLETFAETVGDIAAGDVKSKGVIAKGLDVGATTIKGFTDTGVGEATLGAIGMTKGKDGRYSFANSATAGVKLPAYLEPYRNLYGLQATGFEYYMPYFHTDWKQVKSTWGDTEGGIPMITDLADKEGVFKTFTNTMLMDQNTLGAYIERPQMYTYGSDQPSISFSIVLSNTNDEDDIIRNWHLAFMLAYQNLPNKTSKVFLEPPVIYEIEVPGQTYFPYAYIDNLAIVNRGATRVMKIPYYNITSESEPASIDSTTNLHRTQSRWDAYSSDKMARNTLADSLWKRIVAAEKIDKQNKIKMVEAIIPDAFEITISIKSLLPETKNLLFHSTLGSGTLGSGIYTAHVPNA